MTLPPWLSYEMLTAGLAPLLYLTIEFLLRKLPPIPDAVLVALIPVLGIGVQALATLAVDIPQSTWAGVAVGLGALFLSQLVKKLGEAAQAKKNKRPIPVVKR